MFFSNSIANKKGFLPRPARFRGWTGDGGREVGSYQQDTVQTGITAITSEPYSTEAQGTEAPSTAFFGNVSEVSTYHDAFTISLFEKANQFKHFEYHVNQRMADETRPVNIAIPIIIYLGEYS